MTVKASARFAASAAVLASAILTACTTDTRESSASGQITQGVNHVGLTVSDLAASTDFFIETLGWRAAGGEPDYPANFVTDGEILITLWQTTDPENATAFDRKNNVGLHHLALTVPDLETLDELHETLSATPNVEVEFSPEFLGRGPTTHMMVRDPSGLRIEFIVPGGKRRATND
ncbi:MAG: VOC family protein [Pseudomonadota bacterium]